MDWEGVVHHSGDNPIKHFCKVFSLPFAPDTKPFSVVENVFPFNKSLKVSLKKPFPVLLWNWSVLSWNILLW